MNTTTLIPPRHLTAGIAEARADAVRAATEWYRRQKAKIADGPQAAAA